MNKEKIEEIKNTLKISKPYNELGTYNYFNCESIEKLLNEYQELKDRIDKAVEITHKILINNSDNRMICSEEEIDYFNWLDREMFKQENLLKGDKE